MAARPVVDGVERAYEGRMKVIRVNVVDPAGRLVADSYGFQFTPTFVFFSPDGDELWRSVYTLDLEALEATLGAP